MMKVLAQVGRQILGQLATLSSPATDAAIVGVAVKFGLKVHTAELLEILGGVGIVSAYVRSQLSSAVAAVKAQSVQKAPVTCVPLYPTQEVTMSDTPLTGPTAPVPTVPVPPAPDTPLTGPTAPVQPEPAVAPEPQPEPTVAPEPQPEPAVAPEPQPEPTVAPEPQPEPAVAPEPQPEPVS